MRSSHEGREQGEDRKPQLVQVTGSSRRAWRWLIRGARRRGQYLAGCEPVCGGITCSGRQDACPASVRSPTVVLLCGLLGVEGMITHPVRCCSVPPTLCRELSTPPVHGAQQMDVHPVRRVRHVVSAPHTPRSVPRLPWSSSLFVPWKCQALTDPFGTRCRPEPAEGKAHSLPRCLTASLSRSLPHRRAASPPRCVVASSVRPSVRPGDSDHPIHTLRDLFVCVEQGVPKELGADGIPVRLVVLTTTAVKTGWAGPWGQADAKKKNYDAEFSRSTLDPVEPRVLILEAKQITQLEANSG